MSVEIVIPSLRQEPVERLVYSLSKCDPQPDVVTVVTNEAHPFDNYGLRARLLRFSSEKYPVGYLDVALRQNVGIYAAECETIVIQGDDQIAPHSMIGDVQEHLSDEYLWGNHRLVDFADYSADQIMALAMEDGESREHPEPPFWHGYQSCYGGMFAAGTAFIQDFGAFDMAFNGLHESEDQQLGCRLMRRADEKAVWIIEPPYSWHSIELKHGDTRERAPWLPPQINGCEVHDLVETTRNSFKYLQCTRCLYYRFNDERAKLFRGELIERYDPAAVSTRSEWL
jgi:hypothetical protein